MRTPAFTTAGARYGIARAARPATFRLLDVHLVAVITVLGAGLASAEFATTAGYQLVP